MQHRGDPVQQVDHLRQAADLRSRLDKYEGALSFTEYRGLLWRAGEPSPYCPKCQTVMHDFPPGANDHWTCGSCDFLAGWCEPLKGV